MSLSYAAFEAFIMWQAQLLKYCLFAVIFNYRMQYLFFRFNNLTIFLKDCLKYLMSYYDGNLINAGSR